MLVLGIDTWFGWLKFAQGVIFRHCAERGPRSTYFWAQVEKQEDSKRQEWIVHSPGKVGINRIIISAIGLGLPSRSALSYRTWESVERRWSECMLNHISLFWEDGDEALIHSFFDSVSVSVCRNQSWTGAFSSTSKSSLDLSVWVSLKKYAYYLFKEL